MSEAAQERSNHRHRRFRIWPDEGGMYKVEGRVTPEVGALLMRAIEAGMDAMFCPEAVEETTAVQRRADALGLVAERALAAGFGGEADEEDQEDNVSAEPSGQGREAEGEQGCSARDGRAKHGPTPEKGSNVSGETLSTRPPIPAPDDSAESQATRIRSTRPERYQVFLHVDYETLKKHGEGEKCHLEDGTRVSPETCRRLTCDCSLVKVLRNENGEVLNVGRRTRSIPPAIRRAVEIRDQGCRWPGCGLRFTVPHHVEHWADGGETRLGNLLSLCHFHHRKVHEDGWDVVYNAKDDTAVFWGPAGQVRAHRPPALGVRPEVAARGLRARNRRQGVDPKGPICSARGWWREREPWEDPSS
jgi:hypothetical protein